MTIAATLVTAIVTIVLMLAFRPVALALGLVDRPGGRKRHVGEIPVIGGAAMFLGAAVGILLLPAPVGAHALILVAGGLLVLVGVIDDRFHLPASVRLIAQLAAVLITIFGAGLVLRDIGDPLWIGQIRLGPLSVVVTTLIFVATINAFNLVDGLDGLCGSMALIALVAVGLVALNGSPVQMLAGVLAAAVVGYLVFNLPVGEFRPYRAFMGDAGSTFLGLCVVWLTVSICQGPERVVSPVHGLWFAALPIYDLFTCFVRRIADGRSPFDPGRDHYHHILREAGMSVPAVTGTLAGLQIMYAGFGVACFYTGVAEPLVFTVWAVVGLLQLLLVRAIGNLYRKLETPKRAASRARP